MKSPNSETTIHELYEMDLLSVRTFNVCKYSDLLVLKDIYAFYQKNGSFKKIRNCGQKSDDELIELCKEYGFGTEKGLKFETLRRENNTQIQQLLDLKLISIRAFNLCKYSGLSSLDKIVDFFKKHGSFVKIRTCGSKSNLELIKLCKNHMLERIELQEISEGTELQTYSELNAYKKSILNKQIEYILTNISARCKTGIASISAIYNAKEIVETIFQYGFNFEKYRNIGKLTLPELIQVRENISRFIFFLNSISNEELSREYAKLILKTNFVGSTESFEEMLSLAFDSNGKIKLFYLLSKLIDSELLLNRNETRIFHQNYSIIETVSTLSEIGSELDLSKERVRQIHLKIEEEFETYFKFIKNFDIEDIVNYDFNNNSPLIIIDNILAKKINLNEGVNFNSTFYGLALHFYLNKSHSLLGDDETINGKRKSTKTKNYKFYYFIPYKLAKIFNFALFIENIYFKLNERLSESYSLYFEGYLFEFIMNNETRSLDEIKEACEIILLNEFDLIVDSSGYLTFEKNKRKPLLEQMIETFEKEGRSLKVKELLDKINEQNSDSNSSESSLRAILIREKKTFINLRSTSTYGLRKWGNTNDSLKGGTIKNLVYEFLDGSETPMHISEIINHVKKYKETNQRNVLTNLKIEKNTRFKFYKGDFIGLEKKTYTVTLPNYKKIIGGHFHRSTLRRMNGWRIEDVINHYVNKFDYLPVQIRSYIDEKIEANAIKISDNNKLIVNEQNL